ncbi:hypothetical protein UCRPC4_g01121 [Phaeomoniella chlamydospora]|uniref:Uncharacterized protein n=1 Tax=Phaeomoniella chlamydospora TaxID=158046 RepID=A0A0G2EZ16_PHACM|nr:hypothetical protein UCRPC4_g01121 [Phaeomoniella chlamydospora]
MTVSGGKQEAHPVQAGFQTSCGSHYSYKQIPHNPPDLITIRPLDIFIHTPITSHLTVLYIAFREQHVRPHEFNYGLLLHILAYPNSHKGAENALVLVTNTTVRQNSVLDSLYLDSEHARVV